MPVSISESSAVPLSVPPLQATLGGSVGGKSLPFQMECQRHTQWCWAAVTASIAKFYGLSDWSQCKVVNSALGKATCCSNAGKCNNAPWIDPCNTPYYLDRAMSMAGVLAGTTINGNLTWPSLLNQVNSGCPVGVRVEWRNGGGHFIVVDGYTDDFLVDVEDPWYGHSAIPYTQFLTAYQNNGRWTHSYRSKPNGDR